MSAAANTELMQSSWRRYWISQYRGPSSVCSGAAPRNIGSVKYSAHLMKLGTFSCSIWGAQAQKEHVLTFHTGVNGLHT